MNVSTDPGVSAQADAPASPAPTRARARFGFVWLIAAVVFGIVIGLAGGILTPILNRPGDDSVEAGFLRDMSTHHAQAVEMAMIEHAGTTDSDLRFLANDIALTQHGQVNIMQTWLHDWNLDVTSTRTPMAWMPDSAGSVVNGLMPGMATPEQMAALRVAKGKELNVQFLKLMQAHHIGGVHMAQEAIKLSKNKTVTDLAQTMVNSQQVELAAIQTSLTTWQ
jgi:uncharacterized protein (DUF305 family)